MTLEDILVWPNGDWCYRYQHAEMSHLSDDYDILWAESPGWLDFIDRLVD